MQEYNKQTKYYAMIIKINKMLNNDVEVWRKAYDCIYNVSNYSVSNLGRVKNSKGTILKGFINKRNGYEQVNIYSDGKKKKLFVHRLVATAYIENKTDIPNVDHLNHIITDNNAKNLRWFY